MLIRNHWEKISCLSYSSNILFSCSSLCPFFLPLWLFAAAFVYGKIMYTVNSYRRSHIVTSNNKEKCYRELDFHNGPEE